MKTETKVKKEPGRKMHYKPTDYASYRPYFLHVPTEKVKRTFEATTQFAGSVVSGRNLLQTIQSPFPAHNVWRRNEPVATDTIFAQVPAIDTNGQTQAQLFIGRKSLVSDAYGMKTEAEFVNTLEDNIRKRGAMDKLISDGAKVETSRRVKEILRALIIDDWQSEANYQHQNFAEHRWRHIKKQVNWYMNWRAVPDYAWLLCLQWVCDVMNHTAEKSLKWRPPLEVLRGQTIDISILLQFLFWDVVYVVRYPDAVYHGQVGSNKSSEIRGRFVGFAWNVGHALTYKVLTDDTHRIICRSRLRLDKNGENNLKLDREAPKEPTRSVIQSKHDGKDDITLPTLDAFESPFDFEIDDHPSPMGRPPLQDLPEVPIDNDTELLPDDIVHEYHKGIRKPGSHNPNEDPLEFTESLNTPNPTIPGLTSDDMIDRTFLMAPGSDGSRVRAKIIERVSEHKKGLKDQPEVIKFRCLIDNKYEDIVA